jgi:hypothetical protein
MKNCDRTCVSKLIAKARKEYKTVDFWIQGGAVNMVNFESGNRYIGWPGLKFKLPATNQDGSQSKTRMVKSYFAPEYCPICGGKL